MIRSALALLAATFTLTAQTPAPLTLAQAVDSSVKNYPAIRVSQEQINAAAAGIQLARTAYLPKIDTVAQINRATRNNVFGLLLSTQGVIPSMSGPVIGTNNTGTAWASAIGGLITWEPFDFGQRRSAWEAAVAGRTQSEAALKRTQFETAAAAADAYLTLIAAQQTATAAQAGVTQAETLQRTVDALVKQDLRPGADSARAGAELAAARNLLIQAETAAGVARANLSRFTSTDPSAINATPGHLLDAPPSAAPATPDLSANPVVAQQQAVIETAKAQLRILERSYFPHFYLQGAAYARGTGADLNGNLQGGVNGLAPTVQNFALGFTVDFSVLDKPAIQAKESARAAEVRAETARAQQLAVDLRAQWNAAVANVEGARRAAANTPTELAAARAALQQATARYQAGLANIDEIAEAQRLLAQSEIDDALARLSVWRGLLAVAAAAGDIRPFISEASQ